MKEQHHYTIEDLRAFAEYSGQDATVQFVAQVARSALLHIDELKTEVYSYREGYEYWRGEAWKLECEIAR